MENIADIRTATREELESYLESWGFAVYDDETMQDLIEAAEQTFNIEGTGNGPI